MRLGHQRLLRAGRKRSREHDSDDSDCGLASSRRGPVCGLGATARARRLCTIRGSRRAAAQRGRRRAAAWLTSGRGAQVKIMVVDTVPPPPTTATTATHPPPTHPPTHPSTRPPASPLPLSASPRTLYLEPPPPTPPRPCLFLPKCPPRSPLLALPFLLSPSCLSHLL